jgi:ABC-type antimicrobial peptide transport system permease subunit
MAWLAMAANKMRTLLTMLGIIIGIASVVSIVVVGDAASSWCWPISAQSAPTPLTSIPAKTLVTTSLSISRR